MTQRTRSRREEDCEAIGQQTELEHQSEHEDDRGIKIT